MTLQNITASQHQLKYSIFWRNCQKNLHYSPGLTVLSRRVCCKPLNFPVFRCVRAVKSRFFQHMKRGRASDDFHRSCNSLFGFFSDWQDQSRLYFCLNFSTRPPLCANFCWPVKNGWHAEQTSRRSSGLVDLVTKEFPHAQVTLHSM